MAGGSGVPHVRHEGAITSVDVSTRDDVHLLKGGQLGLISVLFLCVTGSAPLAVFMFNFPFSVGAGNELGTPAGFLFATVVLTIFSVGYVQMAQKLRAAGGMFTYVSHGLGSPARAHVRHVAGGGVHALRGLADRRVRGVPQVALAKGFLDIFPSVDVPWIYLALGGIAGVMLMGYFDIKLSAKILGVALLTASSRSS